MLSCMETPLGLMVIGPQGQSLRVQRSHPAFTAGQELLRQALPAEQLWQQLQALMADPLKALVGWCNRFGLSFKDEGATLRLQDLSLNREQWLPLMQRSQAVASSPKLVLELAEKLGKNALDAHVSDVCIHLQTIPMGGQKLALLRKVLLPAAARTGDIVTSLSRGDKPFLVSYADFSALDDGTLAPVSGLVLGVHTLDDVLVQPAVLGFNRTYQCEEGSADGWLADLSFDSLKEARMNAQEIQTSGAEARIINRITGEPVSVH